MKHLDLFSGIGGFGIAAELSGHETIAFCEIDEKPRKVLKRHWPDLYIHKDIRELDGTKYRGVGIITGGYPCQPFSVAGNQKAQEDDRHLWPEMFRVISQAEPTWVICENVYGHVKLGLDKVLFDLESNGYSCQSFVIPSVATGRPHRRDRVYIVAYSASYGLNESKTTGSYGKADEHYEKRTDKNSNDERCSSIRSLLDGESQPIGRRGTKPPPVRVDAELPGRMDRNRMIGNAIDPLIAYELMRFI
jgi:DNA (cytosine-5)-methyltransferase 1